MNLGRWYKSALSDPHQGDSGYESLETPYSWICELSMRTDHDPPRKHNALGPLNSSYKEALEYWKSHKTKKYKQSTGIRRGDVSVMIDNILSNMYPDWNMYDARRRSELRAKFHDKRRYGNRWSILVASLRPSILFSYSAELAKIVDGPLSTASSMSLTRRPKKIPLWLWEFSSGWPPTAFRNTLV